MSMPPAEFLTTAMVKGYRITVKGESLAVIPPPDMSVPASFRRYVIANKPELLAILSPPQIARESASQTREDRGELSHVSEHSHGLAQEATAPSLPPGAWRSPERIAQEKLFYLLSVGEMRASWKAGKPLHQGSVLADPRRWVELAWGRYAPLWHRAEDTTEPGLRARLEADRELLFSEALGVILQAAYIESRAT